MTKDPITVLREALEEIRKLPIGSRHGYAAWEIAKQALAATAPAAIQPAGDIDGWHKVGHLFQHGDTGRELFVSDFDLTNGFESRNPRLHRVGALYRPIAPVSAPVPEAKAEQAFCTCVMEDLGGGHQMLRKICDLCKTLNDDAKSAASTEKQGVSRLPPLPDPEGEHDYTWGQMKRYALEAIWRDRAARQAAPAVKHEASELPTKAMLLEAIGDKVARSEDLMSDFPPHRAMERWNEASATLKDIVNRLFDARSPVAAPEYPLADTERIQELEATIKTMKRHGFSAPDSARDAALDALAAQFSQPYMEYFGSDIQDAIRAIKVKG